MENWVSAASMLLEKIMYIAEAFLEVPANLWAQLKNVEEIFQMINNVVCHS